MTDADTEMALRIKRAVAELNESMAQGESIGVHTHISVSPTNHLNQLIHYVKIEKISKEFK